MIFIEYVFQCGIFSHLLRQRIFSALGDFSENPKEKLAREKKKGKRLRYSQEKKVGRKKAEYVGREVDARLWDFGEDPF